MWFVLYLIGVIAVTTLAIIYDRGLDKIMEEIGRKRVILDRDGKEPYMIRYYLWRKGGEGKGANLFLHKILKSDEDEHLHDHKWPFKTFILKGSYIEEVYSHTEFDKNENSKKIVTRKIPKKRFSYISRKNTHYHKLEIPNDEPTWTLFWHGKSTKSWGFLTNEGSIDWKEYLDIDS